MPARKVAIVTGGNRGIGREIARQLARAQVSVVIGARDPAKGEKAAAEMKAEGLEVASLPLDVIDTRSVRRFVEQVDRQFGAPGILVNNAGVFPEHYEAKVTEVPTSIWRETLETNLFGAVRMCREVVPMMQRVKYGRIVNISSGMGQMHKMGPGSPAYRVSKAALNALTRIMSRDDERLRVNAVCPGWVKTDLGGPGASRSVEQGARGIVWAATLSAGGPRGGFYRDGKPLDW